MARNFLSILAGYAIFVVTSLVLFKVSGQNPHADPSTVFILITAIYGMTFSFVAGLVTKLIAKTKGLKLNYILALVIAGFAIFSYLKSEGNHWTQLLAIFLFSPVSILGGMFYTNRYHQ